VRGGLAVTDGDEGGETRGDFEAIAATRVAVAALAPRHATQVDGSHGTSSNIRRMNLRDSAGVSAKSRIASYLRSSSSTEAFSSTSSPRKSFSV
jgi:hypothetical protein